MSRRFSFVNTAFWLIRIAAVVVIVWGSVASLASGRLSGSQWRDLVIFGIAQGSLYALIALGYTMVYGVLRFINFAHGEVFMIGAMVSFFVADGLSGTGLWNGQPLVALLAILLVSMAVSSGVAVGLERVAYRPLRASPRLIPLITSIGASFVLQYSAAGLFGAEVKSYPTFSFLAGTYQFLGITVLKTQTWVIVGAILMMVGLYLFVERTKVGRAMRAVAEDKDTAALMGVQVDRTIVTTFAVGGAMAGVAGVLYALSFRQVFFLMGFFPGIKAFTAAVVGGIGNIWGAMLGGLVLGLLESLGPGLVLTGLGIPSAHQLDDVITFAALVLVLVFRPTGLLGERLAEERG